MAPIITGNDCAMRADECAACADERADHNLYDTKRFSGEERRNAALEALEMLDTPRESVFDNITDVLKRTFNTVGSHMVLIDPSRCWFKSWQGIWCDYETEEEYGKRVQCVRHDGWCNYIFVSSTAELLVIEDSYQDARVSMNPFVVGPPHFRFYAGAPLVGSTGQRYGTLCVVDLIPRAFSAEKYALLANFAALAVEELERNTPLHGQVANSRLNDIELNRHLDVSLQASREGVLVLDARDSSWPIIFANGAFARAIGFAQADLIGGNFWDVFQPGDKTRGEMTLPSGLGDTFDILVVCKSTHVALPLKMMPAISDRFAPSKATGLPAWAPFTDSRAGILVDPSPGGSEGTIEAGKDIVDDIKCFWFAVVSDASRSGAQSPNVTVGNLAGMGNAKSKHSGSSKVCVTASSTSTATSSGSAFCEYEIPPELLVQQVGPLLGSGSFGKVFRVTTTSGDVAAMKFVDCRGHDDDTIKAQVREIQLSFKLQHPNVVKILSYATSTDGDSGTLLDVLWCTQELCELGTLTLASERGWLRKERKMDSPADMNVLWRVLLDVSSAMAYVHSCLIVHSDLTGRNVLITGAQDRPFKFMAKVCDFGFARYTYGHSFSTQALGTITHMPPEMIRIDDHPILTPESDVWAFGVIAWEAYHGKCAYKGKNPGQICVAVMYKKALEWPAEAAAEFVALMKACLEFQYTERPSFAEVSAKIESQLQANTE